MVAAGWLQRARINAVQADLFYAERRGVRTLRLRFAVQPQVVGRSLRAARRAGLNGQAQAAGEAAVAGRFRRSEPRSVAWCVQRTIGP